MRVAKRSYNNRASNTHRAKGSQIVHKSKIEREVLRQSKSLIETSKNDIGIEINSERNYFENDESMIPSTRRTVNNFAKGSTRKSKGFKTSGADGFDIYIPSSYRQLKNAEYFPDSAGVIG